MRMSIEPRAYDSAGNFTLAGTEQEANCFALILDDQEAIEWCDTLRGAMIEAATYEYDLKGQSL